MDRIPKIMGLKQCFRVSLADRFPFHRSHSSFPSHPSRTFFPQGLGSPIRPEPSENLTESQKKCGWQVAPPPALKKTGRLLSRLRWLSGLFRGVHLSGIVFNGGFGLASDEEHGCSEGDQCGVFQFHRIIVRGVVRALLLAARKYPNRTSSSKARLWQWLGTTARLRPQHLVCRLKLLNIQNGIIDTSG